MAEYFSVDRIENGFAVLIGDKGEKKDVPLSQFDISPAEGMVFRLENNRYICDEQEEKTRRKRISDLQKQLFNK